MPHHSDVTLHPAHYPASLISQGLAAFSITPSRILQLPDGSIHLTFISEQPHTAEDFANHLIRLKRTASNHP